MNEIFLYRLKDTEDRDCCAYIENKPERFECNHYFGGVILCGACYSNHDFADYNDIETILTETEYGALQVFSAEINKLGYGIEKGDKRYEQGIELCKNIQYVYDKLNSQEAIDFFETIKESENEWLKEEYNLSDDNIKTIFDKYYLDYHDRGCVGGIFDDAYECGYEEAFNLDIIDNNNSNNIVSRYFDFEQFGEDLAQDDNYCELDDGRIVTLNY